MAGIPVRLVAVVFATIQASLLLRLVLPFVDQVPRVLRPFAPTLIQFTDALIAPFAGLVEPFDLSTIVELPGAVDRVLQDYVNSVDQAVIVAMIGWAIIGALVLFVLRALVRAR